MECKRCLFSTEFLPTLRFNGDGECEYCQEFDEWCKQYPTGWEGVQDLRAIATEIKFNKPKGGKYDCVVGVSGGLDSSYTLYIAKEVLGLNPLAVNYDNGFDTDTARQNIKAMCRGLKVDLLVYRPKQEEIIDVWKAFLEASVPDVEAPTDIALATVLYKAAVRNKVKYIFNGHSFRTEGWVPKGMSYMDGRYVRDVHRKFGTIEVPTFPNLLLMPWLYWMLIKRIKRVRPLYFIDYKKEEVKELLTSAYGWQWYGAAHAENKFTTWFGGYFRPTKCSFDSRVIHLSAQVRSGLITRADAELELAKAPHLATKYQAFIEDKFGWSHDYMNEIINRPLVDVSNFRTYRKTFRRLKPLFWVMYKASIIPKTFYTKYCK